MRLFAFLLALTAVSPLGHCQPDEIFPAPADTLSEYFGSGGGASIHLTESGFGLGGLSRTKVGPSTSLVVELGIGVAKDAREQQFFIGIFGDTVTPFKRNYAVMAPLQLGLEQRLFARRIESNFRPFVQVSGGPTFGYQWPYFNDGNDNGIREPGEELNGVWGGLGEGELRMGAGGTIAVGAYFGQSRRTAQGVRIGYSGTYFFNELDLLELDPGVESPSRHFVGGPIVSFHLIRLFN